MPDWSRRRALQAVATTGALALAGCSGETSRSGSVPRDRGEPVPPDEFEVRFVRDTDGGPLFTVGDDDRDREEGTPAVEQGTEYLTADGDREELTFRSTEPATALRRFVEGVDLGSRSVYLLQRRLGECYGARLVGVYREDDGVDADFCQALRPADVACSADDRDTVGVAISLPFEGDSFNGYGTGWSSGCERRSTVAREGGDGA
jgi:hypothetical protein